METECRPMQGLKTILSSVGEMRSCSRGSVTPARDACKLHCRPRSTPSATVMLRTRSDSNEPSGNLSQNWKPFQQTKHDRQRIFAMRSLASNHATMNENLHCLNEPRRPFAARLHFAQIVHGNRSTS